MVQLPESNEYTHFKKDIAEARAPLVLVVGAGLSKSAGLPDWRGLRSKLSDALRVQQKHNESQGIKYDKTKYQYAFNQKDYWIFFEQSKRLLGLVTYKRIIEDSLTPKNDELPRAYKALATLRPRGIVSLNLDRFSGDTIASIRQNKAVTPITGFELENKWQSINNENPFVVYLHGILSDSKSWILTHNEFNEIKNREGRELFLKHLYNDFTVLFCGISADDIAVSKPFIELIKSGFSPPRVYWLTNRLDIHVENWSKKIGIQLITYNAHTDQEHNSLIEQFCLDCRSYKSSDEISAPLSDSAKHISIIPLIENDPLRLAELSPEIVRRNLLSIFEDRILGLSADEFYHEFFSLCHKYDYPIKSKAFYLANNSNFNSFFDYKVVFPPVGQGNFGMVYQAQKDDVDFAIKIMHPNILLNDEMLGGFRRGVESMRIITKSNITDVAKLLDSYEIPPTILMEYISGNSLQELMDGISVEKVPFHSKISVMSRVAEIVDNCHRLAENVLHRDIKPSNIMICGLDYQDYSFERVVVLDFDMSWHKGSHGKDVIFETRDDFGYLAPEQTSKKTSYTSRSTKVDSYGFGMTLYSFISGEVPIPNAGLSGDWLERVRGVFGSANVGRWVSLRNKLARLVRDCTKVDQKERLEFSSVRRRIEGISEFLEGKATYAKLEILSEETLALIGGGAGEYDWDDVEGLGEIRRLDGVKVVVRVDAQAHSIQVSLYFESKGGREYKEVEMNVKRANDAVLKLMKIEGVSVESHTTGPGQFMVTVKFDTRSHEVMFDYSSSVFMSNGVKSIIEQLVK
jgi:hypothetical protein